MAQARGSTELRDYIILGGGPAGLQTAYYLARNGHSYVLLDRASEVGSFFHTYPRHRMLISINKVHTGTSDPELKLRWDWNSLLSDEFTPLVSDVSREYFPPAQALLAHLEQFRSQHGIQVEFDAEAQRISRADDGFTVETADGRRWTGRRLVVATGTPQEYTPDIPGIELCERYGTMSTDRADFENQRVLIIGKGNSAFETADHLVPAAASIHLASPHPLRMAWRTHFVGDLRAVNNNFLDTYQLKSQNAVIDGEIMEIRPRGDGFSVDIKYARAGGEIETLAYDRIIVCAGFCFDPSPFDESCRPALTECGRWPLQSSAWESTNVPGMFFAGSLMQQRDYKRYMSAFIHGFRYNIAALAEHFETAFHGQTWPRQQLTYSARGVAAGLLQQINRSSSLWQQPGFLTTVVQLDDVEQTAWLLKEASMDYASERFLTSGTALALTLEYGPHDDTDPFRAHRVHREDVDNAQQSKFSHPVVRRFENGEFVDEHHVIEDLAAEWVEPEHIDPLVTYLKRCVKTTSQTRLKTSNGVSGDAEGTAKSPSANAAAEANSA